MERRPLAAAVFAAACAVVLGISARVGVLDAVDVAILGVLQASFPLANYAAWAMLSAPGAALIVIPVTGVVAAALAGSGRLWAALYAIIATAGGYGLMFGLKALVGRPRPELSQLDPLTGVLGLAGWDPGSPAFPSGHALMAAIVYPWVALSLPARWRPLALLVAGLIVVGVGASRVALGAHWASDVAASWFVGATWVLLLRAAQARSSPVVP